MKRHNESKSKTSLAKENNNVVTRLTK